MHEKDDAEFPVEIWLLILGYLTTKDLLRASEVSKLMNLIALDPSLWTSRALRHDLLGLEEKKIQYSDFKKRSRFEYSKFPYEKINQFFFRLREGAWDEAAKLPITFEDLLIKGSTNQTPYELAFRRGSSHPFFHIIEQFYTNEEGVDVKKKDPEERTLLHWAARSESSIYIKQLIELGARIDGVDKNKKTPLRNACDSGHFEGVKALLEMRASIKAACRHRRTLLHIAAEKGYLDIARVLLREKAEVNAALPKGATPLYIAALKGHLEIVKVLLDEKAEVNVTLSDGSTPLYIAALKGHFNIVKVLLDAKAEVNVALSDGSTPLFIAAFKGHLDIVKILLEAKAKIDAAITNGATPLYIAAEEGYIDIVKLLLKAEAKVNVLHTAGGTPLHTASFKGHLNIVKVLLEAKAEVNDSSSLTPLQLAASRGYLEIVKVLLKAGAKVDASPTNAPTPLYISVVYRQVNIVKALLKAGADMDAICNSDKETPFMKAKKLNNTEILIEFAKAKLKALLATQISGTCLSFSSEIVKEKKQVQEDKAAAIALANVIFKEESIDVLTPHQKALTRGALNEIYMLLKSLLAKKKPEEETVLSSLKNSF